VAELGVIGRAEDMHRIMDAERDATLAYLDALTAERGGRRGRAAVPTATTGLVYAHARHATSRAGDPGPHDHVLLANVVEMLDACGGFKGADTALWRDHVHAATIVGRVAAARVAVELGYAIEADPGPSGRLGHWAIAGVPREVIALHSKRSADIDEAIEARGFTTYQARQVAARDTRRQKRHESVDDLLPRWHAELEAAGWPVPELVASVERAARERAPVREQLDRRDQVELAQRALAPEGELTARKVFSRRDVVVAVGPALFGTDPANLDRVVDRVLADPMTVPLIGVPGARERAYTTAHVLAVEHAIEALVAERSGETDAPRVPRRLIDAAVAERERTLGGRLTAGQRRAVQGMCASGRGVEVVVGVAGAGKTTVLAAVRDAYAAADFEVIGTATSGQAARTLGDEAGMESRTLASLLWRLDHGRPQLNSRSVVVLDEAGMTDDPNVLRLLGAAAAERAKVVMVGDHRQLSSVGPGGSLEALVNRYGGSVHLLAENVRQRDAKERRVLAELRAGSVTKAISWYRTNGRVVAAPDRSAVIDAVVDAWGADVAAGKDSAMLAWRRANVAELNLRGRAWWAEEGRIEGPEVVAPGGRRYAAGDRVVTLAPARNGRIVTSERGTVLEVVPKPGALVVRMADGRIERLEREDIGADRLDHGYAVTVHRSQGATCDTAHRLEDGGGRELAYVGMSRARERSSVYVVADDIDQAAEDLRRDWVSERRQLWAIDRGTPGEREADAGPARRVPAELEAALAKARLEARRRAITAALPDDPEPAIARLRRDLHRLREQRTALLEGRADSPAGRAVRDLAEARGRRSEAERHMASPLSDRGSRRRSRAAARQWAELEQQADVRYQELVPTALEKLDHAIATTGRLIEQLSASRERRQEWLDQHPEAAVRLAAIDQQLIRLDTTTNREATRERGRDRHLGLGL
jgi:conjugative relaxase-like TrwC/TraI family protein